MSRNFRIIGIVVILFHISTVAGPVFAQENITWGSVKATYAQPNSATGGSDNKINPDVPNPFPFEILLQGDVDLYTAQLVCCQIGLSGFAGKTVVAIRDPNFSDDIVIVDSNDNQADLYWHKFQAGVQNHAIMTLNADGSIHYVDTLGRVFDVPADYDPNAKILGITNCELGMGLVGLAQCTVIGLAGVWFGVACGVKWVFLSSMVCN